MPTHHSGKNGGATVGGTALPVISWQFNPTGGTAEFVNSLTGGFAKNEGTIQRGSGTIVVDHDFAGNPFQAPLSITPTTTVANVFLQIYTAKGWTIPSAVITGTPQSVVIDGKIATSISFVTDGAFTPPA